MKAWLREGIHGFGSVHHCPTLPPLLLCVSVVSVQYIWQTKSRNAGNFASRSTFLTVYYQDCMMASPLSVVCTYLPWYLPTYIHPGHLHDMNCTAWQHGTMSKYAGGNVDRAWSLARRARQAEFDVGRMLTPYTLHCIFRPSVKPGFLPLCHVPREIIHTVTGGVEPPGLHEGTAGGG